MTWITLIVLAAFAQTPTAPAPSADMEKFFANFAAKRDAIQVLEAEFTQKTIYPDEILTTEGDLVFAKPRRLVFHTADPERTTLLDGKRVYEYEPEIKQATAYDIGDNPQADIFFFGFDNDISALRKSYEVAMVTLPDETRGKNGLLIKPKAENTADSRFKEVTLYLRDEDYLPYRIRIVNDEESQVIVDFSHMTVNGKIDPARTQLSLAEGTKIIENDVPLETVASGGKRIPDPVPLADAYKSAGSPEEKPKTTADEQVKIIELPPPPKEKP